MQKPIASHWHVLRENDNRDAPVHHTIIVQCTLCPRACILDEGQRGWCYGRINNGGRLVLDIPGRISGLAVDPIEKKPLYHFHPGSRTLSFGTIGCNLSCRFCQNHVISTERDTERLSGSIPPEDIVLTAKREGCSSVAFTYNEPIIFMEYAIETAIACHEAGLETVAVTAGYVNDGPRREFFHHIDAVNVDLKSFSPEWYHRVCGGRLDVVLETISHIARETSCWMEVTNLLIPEENDDPGEVHALCDWLAEYTGPETPLHFSAFHPAWKMTTPPPTSRLLLLSAREIARSHGLHHVYIGNVSDREGSTTRCHLCGEAIIVRSGYSVITHELNGNLCARCGTPCPGRFLP